MHSFTCRAGKLSPIQNTFFLVQQTASLCVFLTQILEKLVKIGSCETLKIDNAVFLKNLIV